MNFWITLSGYLVTMTIWRYVILQQLKKRGGRRYVKTAVKGPLNGDHDTSEKTEPAQNKIESVERCILKEVAGSAEYYDNMVGGGGGWTPL